MRTQAIRRVPFVAPLQLGMEVMTFDRLRALAPAGVLAKPVRPDFHSLLLVTSGQATLSVDFDEHFVGPGSVIWIRPGQVQQFGDEALTGDLILFQAEFLLPGTLAAAIADDAFGSVATDGFAPSPAATDGLARMLHGEYANAARGHAPTSTQSEMLRHLLSVLILSLRSTRAGDTGPPGLARCFCELLERDFASAHDVEHYAHELGYSQRTLQRATLAERGESPKQVIDRRIVLEARRLLAHTDRSVASIARELGFSDPSNFSSFFTLRTEEAPSAFRLRSGLADKPDSFLTLPTA